MHTSSAQRTKLDRLWLALATVAGLTLLEAAQLAHGVQQAVRWCRWSARGPARAGRALVGALLRRWGWALQPAVNGRWRAERLDGQDWIACDGLIDFLRSAHADRITLAGAAEHLRIALAERQATEEALYKAQEANMENGRRALELEARLGRLGAQLEAMEVRPPCTTKEPCGDCARCVAEVLDGQAEWRRLFFQALALAVLNDARVREVSLGWSRAYHELDKVHRAWSVQQLRIEQRKLRAERREAAALRRACQQALEALEDPANGGTAEAANLRQKLRSLLGHKRLPTCKGCGVDRLDALHFCPATGTWRGIP